MVTRLVYALCIPKVCKKEQHCCASAASSLTRDVPLHERFGTVSSMAKVNNQSRMKRNNNKALNGTRAHAVCRGLFSRIARKLNVDPSYVSRVASGERVSRPIEQAISMEFKRLAALFADHA